MAEIKFIADQLRLAFDGEAWHGPALVETLQDVDAKAAAAHPLADGHSIWELVLHVTAWERVILRRMQGETATVPDKDNFGHIRETSERAWREAVRDLRSTHDELVTAVSRLPEKRLDEQVPGKNYDLRFMLTGAVQHAAYHGGQISLLKKAQA
jgi:uncharacterized damage-inducible protein DinB